ncbi:putative leader peptide [Lentzea sp. NPDC058450]|uniref:putative leader peptide n=1 Tax=Lentzea sp. NPDC058450 TaxID=3346505 RepID=UPI0036644F02
MTEGGGFCPNEPMSARVSPRGRPGRTRRAGVSIGGVSQASVLSTRRHVDLRRQASAICAVPAFA